MHGAWKESLGGDKPSEYCKQQLYYQPNGPFAVALYCGDALGDQIAILYYPHDTEVPGDRATMRSVWVGEPFAWFDPVWSTDVTSFTWGFDGRHLFVGTSCIYGSGGLFALELANRSVSQLQPVGRPVTPDAPSESIFVITGLDRERDLLAGVEDFACRNSGPESRQRFSFPVSGGGGS